MNLVGECHGASPGPQGSIRMHVTVNNTIGQVNLFQDGAKRCTTSCHIQGFRKKCHSYVSRHVGTRGHIYVHDISPDYVQLRRQEKKVTSSSIPAYNG